MLRDTLVRRADSVINTSFGDPTSIAAYLEHNYNGDTESDARQMGRTQSSCLLHIRGLLAHDEVDGIISYQGRKTDVLHAAYAKYVGQIESIVEQFCRQRGLYVEGDKIAEIQPAFVLVIGLGGQAPPPGPERDRWLVEWGGITHASFVTKAEQTAPTSWKITSVDGGQNDSRNIDSDGRQRPTAIHEVVQSLVRRQDGHWWLGKRRLRWFADLGALPVQG